MCGVVHGGLAHGGVGMLDDSGVMLRSPRVLTGRRELRFDPPPKTCSMLGFGSAGVNAKARRVERADCQIENRVTSAQSRRWLGARRLVPNWA